jgi:hypothetical protein
MPAAAAGDSGRAAEQLVAAAVSELVMAGDSERAAEQLVAAAVSELVVDTDGVLAVVLQLAAAVDSDLSGQGRIRSWGRLRRWGWQQRPPQRECGSEGGGEDSASLRLL